MSATIHTIGKTGDIIENVKQEFIAGRVCGICIVWMDPKTKVLNTSWGEFDSFIEQIGAVEQVKDCMFRSAQGE